MVTIWFTSMVLLGVTNTGNTATDRDVATEFVTLGANGRLELAGKPWRFSGCNIYWLGLDENVPTNGSKIAYPTRFRVEDALGSAAEMGANVVRAHTLGVSTGNKLSYEPKLGTFADAAANHIAMAINAAKDKNIRLIVPLTDNWNYYHGACPFLGVCICKIYICKCMLLQCVCPRAAAGVCVCVWGGVVGLCLFAEFCSIFLLSA